MVGGMDATAPVQVGAGPDGTITYVLPLSPDGLPAVRRRDLIAAWDAARDGARHGAAGTPCRFRFRHRDGCVTELTLADREARCWVAAVGRVAALQTQYGVALCLRLLALVDLLSHAAWTAPLLAIDAGLARLHPALLRLAAATPLLPDARFDEASFRSALSSLPFFAPGAIA